MANSTPGNDDQRLAQIQNLTPDASGLSAFNYTYDAEGIIQTWAKQLDSGSLLTSNFSYDSVDQLISASVPSAPSVLKKFRYLYDRAGNRTSEQIDSGVAAATVNNLNQVTALGSTGPIHFAGGLSEPANVTVNGVAAKLNADNSFSADVPLSPGAHNVPVVATDGNGAISTKTYQVAVTDSGVNRTLTYDANGNLTNDGAGRTYTFDAANELVSVTQTVNGVLTVTGYAYDGYGRRVEQTLNGTLIKQWVWCGGTHPCEERDASNNVTKRFYSRGEQINGVNYFYAKDHLGSIRELTDGTGAIRARYDYDPYGRQTKLSGDLDADFGFCGYYNDLAAGGWATEYRILKSDLGRWLNPDPIGEAGGINLYSYVFNNPINAIDPLGLEGSEADDPAEMDVEIEAHLEIQYQKTAEALGRAKNAGDIAESQRLKEKLNDISRQLGSDPDNPRPGPSDCEFRDADKPARSPSQIDRNAFRAEREAFWKTEAENNPGKYKPEDLARMKTGRAPIGPDGFPMELHHIDRTPTGGLDPMSRTDHRLGDNYSKNHP